ncbi:bifunctional acetate--CoA ligase family protein/GNAT family N-acetyltransferase [Alysiella sp.]|uniref:bifunctional acetate--CoA ligase family protein/GNAT family N-acetyltransferase n=1 Tax=Alysiella sp. TaxID=1872483 RepID=UPI0026DB1A23|nr:bifunctional acetate--CoA ligase family protein/GNAT family N-acetyltransferase [Alysiella sp.]
MQHTWHTLFQAQKLAVVGASDRYGSLGRRIFSQLCTDCTAQLIPINPQHKTIGGITAYDSLSDAAEEHIIDAVIIIVATEKINGIVREAIKNQVRQIIVVNEMENISASARRQLLKATENAHKAGIMLTVLRASSLPHLFQRNNTSGMAYIGQSSDIADCIKQEAQNEGLAFHRFVIFNPNSGSILGNSKLIEYIAAEHHTTALLLHIHNIDQAHEWVNVLNAVTHQKPIVVLLTLNNPDEAHLFEQALNRCHILIAHTLADFFTAAKLLHSRLHTRGNRLSIISNTPHITTLTLQKLSQYQLHLAQPPIATTRALSRLLSRKPESHNPVFLPTDAAPTLFQAALQQQIDDESNDAILILYGSHHAQDALCTAHIVAQMQTHTSKPLLLVWLGQANTPEVQQLFHKYKTLHFRQPEHALSALFQLNAYREHRRNSYPISTFHDYHHNHIKAQNLHEPLRPMLPMTTLPASRNATNQLLTVLQLSHSRSNSPSSFVFQWSWQTHFGQILTLIHQNQHIVLLPPIQPEIIKQTLQQLMLPETIWANWLLNTADLLHRLPEIQYLQLILSHDHDKWLYHSCKLHLQDPNTTAHNLFTCSHHTTNLTLNNGDTAILRTVRAEDAELIRQHIEHLTPNSRKMRFMVQNESPSPSLLSRLSRPDYQREYALILHTLDNNPLAFAHYTADLGLPTCEFGISIADELQGQGLGILLMQKLIEHAQQQGFQTMRAEILKENIAMQKLASKLGFALTPHANDKNIIQAQLPLKNDDTQAA